MKRSRLDPFDLEITLQGILMQRDEGELRFRPGEAAALQSLLHVADGMEHLETLPSHIDHSPFQVRFRPDEKLEVRRNDEPGGRGLVVTWREVDTLIQAAGSAVQIALDQQRLQKPVAGVARPNDVGVVHEDS